MFRIFLGGSGGGRGRGGGRGCGRGWQGQGVAGAGAGGGGGGGGWQGVPSKKRARFVIESLTKVIVTTHLINCEFWIH